MSDDLYFSHGNVLEIFLYFDILDISQLYSFPCQ
jgi:hypothetical protein